MGDFTPIVVAIITTAGAIAAAFVGTRRFRRSPDNGTRIESSYRDLYELEKAKGVEWERRYKEEVLSRQADTELATSDKAAVVEDLRHAERTLDDCERQRDDLYAELRHLTRAKLTLDREQPEGGVP